ncbi:MAG TPA: M23 family metallopeptidase [Archangium sp.]|jgi:murein DD-endopeptidase MepM/ murein hydrolase activator NlpD|uniref:M23 family metallopeptidase n=1 Tax=Archangium sp. TaxID=1872627 RepID=UPI002ED9630A
MKRIGPLLSCAAMLVACGPQESTEVPVGPVEVVTQRVSDEVAGVSIDVPSDWRVQKDPVLFNTYGFALFDPSGPSTGGHERSPVARIALAYQVKPEQIEGLVQDLMSKYPEFPLTRTEVVVGQGLRGIAVSGLPGTDSYSLVYVADGERVYRIGLWTEEPGLDNRARGVLASLKFEQPRKTVQSLNLVPVEQAMRAEPPAEQLALNKQAQAERAMKVALEGGEPQQMEAPAPVHAMQTACEFGQPGGMFWQTVWDYTNKFYSGYTTVYSGTYYNLRPGDPGWSAMSGNYGSWWGQNYHVRKCNTGLLNQFYANDWPAHKNANVYPAITGTVEWAGWDYYDSEGYYTLGNYVVVRNNGYRAIMAHLTSVAVSAGNSVGMNTIIGYAGKTGGPWDEHVHSRVAYGESRTYNGQPYGGSIVWPNKLRCVDCRANDPGDAAGNGDGQFDVKDSSGAKFYTRFYHGRWMRG